MEVPWGFKHRQTQLCTEKNFWDLLSLKDQDVVKGTTYTAKHKIAT